MSVTSTQLRSIQIELEMNSPMLDFEEACNDAPKAPVRHESVASSEGSTKEPASRKNEILLLLPKKESLVNFGNVYRRLYDRDLDFNPSTSTGPSIGLSWRYKDLPAISLGGEHLDNRHHRSTRQLILSRDERENILIDCGYSRREISQATRSNSRARLQRKETLNRLTASAMAGVNG